MAIKSLLREENGKYYLPLSSSPEIFDNEPRSYLTPNSNFDLALLIYLFETLKKYSEILGKDEKEYDEIKKTQQNEHKRTTIDFNDIQYIGNSKK